VNSVTPQDRLARAVTVLDDFYGRPMLSPRYPPVDELVFTVLSQNTADVNTERSFAALKARFPDWVAARDAEVDEIEAAIASAAWRTPRRRASRRSSRRSAHTRAHRTSACSTA